MTCDVLAVGAHPDDVELMCGGLLAKLAAAGRTVGILDLTRGEMGTRGTPEQRASEAESARKILGAEFRDTLDLGDGNLRTDRNAELEVIRVIRRRRPRLVVAPYRQTRHPDHGRAARLVTEASFYAGLRALDCEGEAHRPHRVIYAMEVYLFAPTFLVDVSEVWETKMRAVRAFGSQVAGGDGPETFISRPEFLEMIEARGRHFGSQVGVRYAEAFFSDIPPRVEDPLAAYSGLEV